MQCPYHWYNSAKIVLPIDVKVCLSTSKAAPVSALKKSSLDVIVVWVTVAELLCNHNFHSRIEISPAVENQHRLILIYVHC